MLATILMRSFLSHNRKWLLFIGGIICLAAVLFLATAVRFNFTGVFEGIYLLRGSGDRLYEVKDEILLGEYERVIGHVEFGHLFLFLNKSTALPLSGSYLEYAWDAKHGEGYVISHFPGDKRLMTAFGRFLDSQGAAPVGLFLGGGLPYEKYKDHSVILNETGMAYYDGEHWFHLWCNANEAIIAAHQPVFPAQWEFLGSSVVFEHQHEVIIRSGHRVTAPGATLHIDRFAFFKAGDTFFTLMIRIRNDARVPVRYQYLYGDEPWVGNYGTSVGNVGWTREGLRYYEGRIDTSRHSFAGMADYGNRVLPQEQNRIFSGMANFIQWLGAVRPNLVYFSNTIGSYADEKLKVPLSSPDNRVLFVEWGPRELQPDQSEIIMLAVGMAGIDREAGLPLKPPLQLNREDLDFVISHH